MEISWNDGSGDVITLSLEEMEGNKIKLIISSPENLTGKSRTKDIVIHNNVGDVPNLTTHLICSQLVDSDGIGTMIIEDTFVVS